MSDDPRSGPEPTRPLPSTTGWNEPTQQISQPWQSGYPASEPTPPYSWSQYAAPGPAPQTPQYQPGQYYPVAQPPYYEPAAQPPQYYPIAQPPERQSSLGWVSLGLSVVALVLSVVAGVVTIDSWTSTDLETAVADEAVIESLLKISIGGLIAQIVATMLGLAGLITGAVSLANRTSRLVGAFGLALALAAPMISSVILTGMLPVG
ncbi:hypothetical protein [Acidipropionibacterium virtanenii]|uniref:Uncharacterized protein n=1 Tax=Acidipropionibacterium virtanenii TaxID=2057246 RepID=A0A344UUT2_9ACTN|nr:hypothetical protein [Acidipropionibacterium virtanenii]AXE39030.1 hypothetical protein JS278_01874 [Acidipropionibacterium virtanenii]